MSQAPTKLSRRTVFAGAGAASAVAVIASLMPSRPNQTETPQAALKPKPARGGGYSLSKHVQQYYKTTRV